MKKIYSYLLLFVLFFSVLSPYAERMWAEEDAYDFASISSASTIYLNKTVSPFKSKKEDGSVSDMFNVNNVGNAGVYIGFPSQETEGWEQWLQSAVSKNTVIMSYSSLRNISGSSYDPNNALYGYVLYGYALKEAGLDHVNASVGASGFISFIAGVLILFCTVLLNAMNVVMQFIISFLKILNPFTWFGLADIIRQNPNISFGDVSLDSPFRALTEYLSAFYNMAYNLGWELIIPIFIVCIVLGFMFFFMGSSKNKPIGMIRRLITYVLFISIIFPFVGSASIAGLDSIGDMEMSNPSLVNRLVYSNYLDFRAWAENSRLSLPQGRTLKVYEQSSGQLTLSPLNKVNIRSLVYEINANSGAVANVNSSNHSAIDDGGANKWNKQILKDIGTLTGFNDSVQEWATVQNLLKRYMNSELYTEGEWSSAVNAYLTAQNKATEEFGDSLKKMSKVKSYPEIISESQILNNGNIVMEQPTSNHWSTGSIMGIVSTRVPNVYTFQGQTVKNGLDIDTKGGLSTLSMYNYLASDFGDNAVESSYAFKMGSSFLRYSHSSVVYSGQGLLGFAQYINMLALLGCSIIIGYSYIFALFVGFLRRIMLITLDSIPAFFGGVNSMARIVTMATMIFVSLLVTVFTYYMAMQLLYAIFYVSSDGISVSAHKMFSALWGTNSTNESVIFSINIIVLLFSSVSAIIFSIVAIKARGSVIYGFEDGITNFTNWLFNANNKTHMEKTNPLMTAMKGFIPTYLANRMANKDLKDAQYDNGHTPDVAKKGLDSADDEEKKKQGKEGDAQDRVLSNYYGADYWGEDSKDKKRIKDGSGGPKRLPSSSFSDIFDENWKEMDKAFFVGNERIGHADFYGYNPETGETVGMSVDDENGTLDAIIYDKKGNVIREFGATRRYDDKTGSTIYDTYDKKFNRNDVRDDLKSDPSWEEYSDQKPSPLQPISPKTQTVNRDQKVSDKKHIIDNVNRELETTNEQKVDHTSTPVVTTPIEKDENFGKKVIEKATTPQGAKTRSIDGTQARSKETIHVKNQGTIDTEIDENTELKEGSVFEKNTEQSSVKPVNYNKQSDGKTPSTVTFTKNDLGSTTRQHFVSNSGTIVDNVYETKDIRYEKNNSFSGGNSDTPKPLIKKQHGGKTTETHIINNKSSLLRKFKKKDEINVVDEILSDDESKRE